MKVFATVENNGKVELVTFNSVKEFQSKETWTDEKFINIAKYDELESYRFANERTILVHTDIQKESQLMLRQKYFELFNNEYIYWMDAYWRCPEGKIEEIHRCIDSNNGFDVEDCIQLKSKPRNIFPEVINDTSNNSNTEC